MAALDIRRTTPADEPAIRRVHEAAFGPEAVEEIAGLTIELLHDPTAEPLLSLIAYEGADAVGHVLFTNVRITGDSESPMARILAPLAVLPDKQGKGVGTRLVEEGLGLLDESGCGLVFVLGYPAYYTRFGFRPAGVQGLNAPYPIAEKNADAWMVLALGEELLGEVSGVVRCAAALDKADYWQE